MTVSIESTQKITDEYLKGLRETVNAEENPVEYLAIDPGKSNGICGYDAKLYMVFMLTISSTDMVRCLHQFEKVQYCIVEDFKLYPNKARSQSYSNMETSRVIGRIEAWAELKDVKLIKQPATIKETGYKWIGQKPLPKSDKKNHQVDAHVHFMYWVIKSGRFDASNLVHGLTRDPDAS